MTGTDVTDSCEQTPLEFTMPLPPSCLVNIDDVMVSSVNLGQCKNVPCVTQTSSPSDTKCCMPANTRPLLVECEDFSYEIKQTLSCGCADCVYNKKVTVSGRVNNVDVAVTDAYVLYDDVIYNVTDGQFLFEATPMAGRVTFDVKSKYFVSQLVTLDVSVGLTQMYVEVTVVAKPTPFVVDVTTGAELEVDTPGLPSAVSVTIPQDSFQDQNGNPVTGNVNVFLSFSDPRKTDGLDSAPGEFTFQNSEGETQHLLTFGVVTMEVEDAGGNDVFLSGKAILQIDADALLLEFDTRMIIWNIVGTTGQWEESGELTFSGNRRRRRRQTTPGNLVTGQTIIRRRSINIDIRLPPVQLCTVSVYLYYGEDFSVPLRGAGVTGTVTINQLVTFRSTAHTDHTGRACLSVLCGAEHMVKYHSPDGVIAHATHFLPDGFAFSNTADGFVFTADPPGDVQEGPVYGRYTSTDQCLSSSSTAYHFKLAVLPVQPYLYGSLNADDRWFPEPPATWQACAYLVLIRVRN